MIPRYKFLSLDEYSGVHGSNTLRKAYHIIKSISSFLNYFLFVVICICMVVKLRRVLEEKMKKSESMSQKQNETKKAENEKAVNKAIKLIVILIIRVNRQNLYIRG